ncbi:type II toxin-antitoxin system VapC family toxin [Nocardia sp. alder85J]|uniref:type II toxin-antitoxin system VapC family toxin n=1 Tax=Nocardia sp. alder85J TaxID=2862949 RepID=UPI001CD72FD2|nr:type II toxin-antitoxin system VapC family toxin [Nocardia sp. alder85J]MCX4095178.1 type II toxin-antitoxin system VapC family toxin [Nocardia sp. alder85J]
MTSERSERRYSSGLLDTCTLIDLDTIPPETLPVIPEVSAVTVAELAAGVHTTRDPVQRSLRVTRLLMIEANMDPLPFDDDAAKMYGNLCALVVAAGRNPRPRRLDLMIAATATLHRVPLFTRNVDDFKGLDSQLTVIAV